MQIKSIFYFITVVKCKSYSRASEQLFLSQSALSQQIKKLENELGVELFDHSKHKVILTEAGNVFYEDGQHIVSFYEMTKSKLNSLANLDSHTVSFGISPFYSHYYLPILLPSLAKEHPSINCKIVEEISVELEKYLIDETLDFCLVPLQPMNDKLYYDVVFHEEILLAVPKNHPANEFAIPSVGMPYLDLKHLKNSDFIMLKPIQKFYQTSMRLCMEAGFEPRISIETISWDTLNTLVGNGMGVGFVPEIVKYTLPEEKRPNYYRTHAQRTYAIASLKSRNMHATTRVVIDNFKNSFSCIYEHLPGILNQQALDTPRVQAPNSQPPPPGR